MIYYRGPLDKNLITGTAAAAVDCLFQIGGRKESDLYVYHDLYCNQLDSITRLPCPEKSLYGELALEKSLPRRSSWKTPIAL